MRKPFGIRFSQQELETLRSRARIKGWSVGRYIRWKALGIDVEQEDRIKQLEHKVKKLETK